MAQVSSIVLLALIAVTKAELHDYYSPTCVLHATGTAGSFVELGAWLAATEERCSKGDNDIDCAGDVLNTIAQVMEVSARVLAALDACQPKAENHACTVKGLVIASGVTSLTATSLDISQSCVDIVPASATYKFPFAEREECIDKIGDLFNQLGASIILGKHISEGKCSTPASCWAQSLDLINIIMSMADDIWVLFTSFCIVDTGAVPYAGCVGDVIDAVQEISGVGAAALTMGTCSQESLASRKYDSEVLQMVGIFGFSAVNIGLAALLPFTAIVAFALGRRAKNRASQPTNDMESLSVE
jgi:hypothetical protein